MNKQIPHKINAFQLNIIPKIIINALGIIEWVINMRWLWSVAYLTKKTSKSDANEPNTTIKYSKKFNPRKK